MAEGRNVPGHVMTTKKPLFGEDAALILRKETRRLIEQKGIDPALKKRNDVGLNFRKCPGI